MWNLIVLGFFVVYLFSNIGRFESSCEDEEEDPIDEMIENGTYKFGPNYKK